MTSRFARPRGATWLALAALAGLLGAGRAEAQPPAPPAAPASVAGTVVDAEHDTPLARVLVRLADTPHAATTGPDGRFLLAGVAPGRYTLTASVVGYAILRKDVVLEPGSSPVFTLVLTAGTGTHEERVDVVAPVFEARDPGTAAELTLGAAEFQDLKGLVSDDPMRAVQSLPGVAAGDDFSAEFSARGAGPRFTNIVLDGVPASAVLLHAVEGRDDSGSIARISGDVLARATLMLGSYPQRYGDRLGPQLEFQSREGSRDGFHARGVVSNIAAGGILEGPIAGGRGSWLAVVRQSYLQWMIDRIDPGNTNTLGFTDVFAKGVFDVRPGQQVWLSVLGGRAHYQDTGATGANSLRHAYNRGGLATLGWRATGTSWVMTHRVFGLTNRFHNRRLDGQELGWGRRNDGGYRGDVTWARSASMTIEGGLHLQRTGEQQHLWTLDRRTPPRRTADEDFGASVVHGGGFAQVRWTPAAGWSLTGGARADSSALTRRVTASPWVQLERKAGRGTTLRAGTGLYHQAPAFEQVEGLHGNDGLGPQRAWHADAGIEQVLGQRTRWSLTVFDREERNVAWAAGLEPRTAGALVPYTPGAVYENRLEGYARGVETILQRRDPNGLSGWVAYAWTHARYRDTVSGETFDGDYDQRHTVNAYLSLRLWSRTTAIAKFRAGTNLPVRGYYQATGAENTEGLPVFVAGPARNVARLPDYARVDLRVNQAFNFSTRRMTLFVELINVLNRTNVGSTGGRGVEKLLPFIPAAGLLFEF